MPVTNPNTTRQRKTWFRGQQAEFRFSFLNQDQSPMQPLDVSKYPGYAIYSPAGIQFQTGTATAFGSPGSYRVLWTVPVDAPLSFDNGTWSIVCTMLNSRKKTYELSYDFDVIEKQIPAQDDRDVIRFGIENESFRISWKTDQVPYALQLSGFNSDAPDSTTLAPIPGSVTPSGPVFYGDHVAYYYDIPANTLLKGKYTFLWSVQETPTSASEIDIQQLNVMPKRMLQLISSVKTICNKFQTTYQLPNFISSADYMEAVNQGAHYINSWHPMSFYSYEEMMDQNGIPCPLNAFLIMASAWWVLQSQHLVELNLSFQFSGATASLDYDRSSGIESSMGRLQEQFTQNLTPIKMSWKRLLQGMGNVSLRPAQLRSYQNRVIRIDSTSGLGNTSQLMNMMTAAGIAP
jgi:hypothetical protein